MEMMMHGNAAMVETGMADQAKAGGSGLQIVPLTGCLGAEIRNVDLATLDEAGWKAVYDAWVKYLVIFIPNQGHLTPDDHLAIGAHFGRWDEEVSQGSTADVLDKYSQIKVLHNEGVRADRWHADTTGSENPPRATVFRLIEAPAFRGDTIWSNQYAAYESLSAPMRNLLDGLTAFHQSNVKKGLEAVHPVVRTNPETGQRYLFVNRLVTRHIVEMSPSESEALLRYLFDWQEQVRLQVRHTWSPGDVAIWDNCATLHHAVRDYLEPRVAHRLMIVGDHRYDKPDRWAPFESNEAAFLNPNLYDGAALAALTK
ncbi:TauD/TfdA dioxygenase family protein [Rhizorhabdus dicambivorans]|nr:TauD/TfdA family dioxygenase [Rhizorhabdus dicambivorans]